MKQQPTLVVEDRTKEILDSLKKFKGDKILVGIPESDNDRGDDAEIGNAALLFINNFGSPANNIPARPVMEIGMRNAADAIAEEMKKAVQAVDKGPAKVAMHYERAGMIASNSVKRAINDQIDIEPPADSTLRTRESKGFKGTKSLIVTGQMRNAITYVVKG